MYFPPSNNKLSAELKTKLDERYSAYLIDAIISGVSDDITLGNLIAREAALKEEGYEPYETRFALISLLAQKRRELAQFRGGAVPLKELKAQYASSDFSKIYTPYVKMALLAGVSDQVILEFIANQEHHRLNGIYQIPVINYNSRILLGSLKEKERNWTPARVVAVIFSLAFLIVIFLLGIVWVIN